jgi:2-keto-4-pentenoate hydratase/2-oxohepta-3-ene-1,7-dioic acid hydratase in catechol pathway
MLPVRQFEEQLQLSPDAERFQSYGHPLSSVKLWAPVPRPNSIRDFLVFEEHLINSTHAVVKRLFPPAAWFNTIVRRLTGSSLLRPPKVWYEIPIYYKGNADSVIGPEDAVFWPSYSNELDYELEFGVYLWKVGKDISKQDARSHIAGYTIFNDYSARDTQFKEMAGRLGPCKGKDFDTGNVMGPYLVTPDEIADPYSLEMRAYVNGELWSRGNSRTMHYSFDDMITYLSQSETLHPGDFLGSGTVGNGCGLELGRKLKRGDRVTLEVEKLGRLSNTIAG